MASSDAIPFYRSPLPLEKLRELTKKSDLRGVLRVIRTKRRQREDPDYRFMPRFPATARPPKLT